MNVSLFVFQDRNNLIQLMNEQHQSEQNAETYKLKLEQDEETEKLRKVNLQFQPVGFLACASLHKKILLSRHLVLTVHQDAKFNLNKIKCTGPNIFTPNDKKSKYSLAINLQ